MPDIKRDVMPAHGIWHKAPSLHGRHWATTFIFQSYNKKPNLHVFQRRIYLTNGT